MNSSQQMLLYRALGAVERLQAGEALRYLNQYQEPTWDTLSARAVLEAVVDRGSWTLGRWVCARVDLRRALGPGPQEVCVYVGTPREFYRRFGWEAGKRHWRTPTGAVL